MLQVLHCYTRSEMGPLQYNIETSDIGEGSLLIENLRRVWTDREGKVSVGDNL